MVRAAAKNHALRRHRHRPGRLRRAREKLAAGGGKLGFADRYALAAKAFSHTAEYDGMIASWLTARDEKGAARAFPDRLNLSFRAPSGCATARTRTSRPPSTSSPPRREAPRALPPAPGQGALLQQHRSTPTPPAESLPHVRRSPPACIVKHSEPLRRGHRAVRPWRPTGARSLTDPRPRSAASSPSTERWTATRPRPCRSSSSRWSSPRRTTRRRGRCSRPKQERAPAGDRAGVKLRAEPPRREARGRRAPRSDRDGRLRRRRSFVRHEATAHAGRDETTSSSPGAWRKLVKSNAIVVWKRRPPLGVGAGQMSRVDSYAHRRGEGARVRLARRVRGRLGRLLPLSATAWSSLAEAGMRAVIQPGGSVRDAEVIAAADAHGISHGVHRHAALPALRPRP